MTLKLAELKLQTTADDSNEEMTNPLQLEEALRQSEQKYRSLFENMLNGFAYCKMIFDSNGKPIDFITLEMNDAFEKITGLQRKLYLGKKVSESMSNVLKTHPEFFDLCYRIALTGQSAKFEFELKQAAIWLSIIAYCPQKEYLAVIFENITDRKELNKRIEEHSQGLELTITEKTEELNEAQSKLSKAERLAVIGELAGMVGHDLRNPLSGIKNAAYLLKKNPPRISDRTSNEMLTIIDKSLEQADRIINDLLDYSCELHLDLCEYSPKSLIDDSMQSIKMPEIIKNVERTQSSPTIWVDKNKIERAFTNLVTNAIEAMPNGGTLEIANYKNGDNIEFTFSDNGIGMPKEVITKIFNPLFTTKAKGMGFGLAISKRIIEAHGGKITAKSVPNKGTIFNVSLPIKPANP